MNFSDPQQESAVLGYVAMMGFAGIDDATICAPEHFTDERWKVIYDAAFALHRAGRVANQFSINDELDRVGVSKSFCENFPGGWEHWPAHVDSSLALAGPMVVSECFRAIAQFSQDREAAKIGKELAEGSISVEEAGERLQAVRDASRGTSRDSILGARQFDFQNPPPPARRIYELSHKTICTPGNLTSICAKAKAGKSALVGAFIAASFGEDGDTLGIGSMNPDGRAVVHFDSEQSPADHHILIATALFRVKRTKNHDCLRSYRVCDIRLSERFDLLEYELKRARKAHGGIHSVILDGIADFVSDPNDPQEAFATVERLHRLAVEFDTAILNVLHVNPGSETNKTRGHLGSQLERKAESNLILEKDDAGISVVYSTVCRHAHIPKQDGPRFRWEDNAQMHVSCESGREAAARDNNTRLHGIADEVFHSGGLKYGAAITAICTAAKVADKRAQTLFSDMKKAGVIAQDQAGFWEVSK